jgi:hypothetical protein
MCKYISCTMDFTTHYLQATLTSMGLGFVRAMLKYLVIACHVMVDSSQLNLITVG